MFTDIKPVEEGSRRSRVSEVQESIGVVLLLFAGGAGVGVEGRGELGWSWGGGG